MSRPAKSANAEQAKEHERRRRRLRNDDSLEHLNTTEHLARGRKSADPEARDLTQTHRGKANEDQLARFAGIEVPILEHKEDPISELRGLRTADVLYRNAVSRNGPSPGWLDQREPRGFSNSYVEAADIVGRHSEREAEDERRIAVGDSAFPCDCTFREASPDTNEIDLPDVSDGRRLDGELDGVRG